MPKNPITLKIGNGLPQNTFGVPDRTLPDSIDQSDPLSEWMV
ncbi:MAG: hypothetical protein ABF380_15185 [Akkermansiaceae bacterium]